jgi:release factor glutamine methyltransferase
MQKKVPYEVEIQGAKFSITDAAVYGPGSLTHLFLDFLLKNDMFRDKAVLDVGAGYFTLGIVAAKNGAKRVVGTDISARAIACAQTSMRVNEVGKSVQIVQGDGVSFLLPEYEGQFDLILASTPWDAISKQDFATIPAERQNLSLAFYDVDDKLLSDVLANGPRLLAPQGKLLITASLRIMDRIKRQCEANHFSYTILFEKDLHNDGNIHYILEINVLG